MAKYTIYISSHCNKCGSETVTRKRADSAWVLAQKMVYEFVKSCAGLDTLWGASAMAHTASIDPYRGGTVAIGNHGVLYFTRSVL